MSPLLFTFRCLIDCTNNDDDGSILSPLQKAFEIEYDQDDSAYPPTDVDESISLVRYYLNCGATLTPRLQEWRDRFLAERYGLHTQHSGVLIS